MIYGFLALLIYALLLANVCLLSRRSDALYRPRGGRVDKLAVYKDTRN